jgi:hypothetical protein
MPTNTTSNKPAATAKDAKAKPADSKAPAQMITKSKEPVLTFEQQLKAFEDELKQENAAI